MKRFSLVITLMFLSINAYVAPLSAASSLNMDPNAVKIVTSDVTTFWRAFDLAQKST